MAEGFQYVTIKKKAPARWAKSASRCTASSASKETSPAVRPPPGGAADSRHRSKAAPASLPTAHSSPQPLPICP